MTKIYESGAVSVRRMEPPHWYEIQFGSFCKDIHFQSGSISEEGVNGVTNEALLAIVKDRLRCFQAGPFPCKESKAAIDLVRAAISALEERTEDRKSRGVEGKSAP